MKTCKTCKWYATESWHLCCCPKMVYGYGLGRADSDGLRIENDEGWGMEPEPNFGCIHWKQVEE